MSELIAAVKDALLKRQEVEKTTGLGRSAIYNRINPEHPQYDPSFPRPVAVGTSSVRWVSTEVSAWIEARIAERDTRIAERDTRIAERDTRIAERDARRAA